MQTPKLIAGVAGAMIVLGSAVLATAAPSKAQKCLAAKLKEVSKYEACRFKAEAIAAAKGATANTTKCDATLAEGWQKAETKFGAACPTTGDRASVATAIGAHVGSVVGLLDGLVVCGDGNAELAGGEECDGLDLAGQSCAGIGFLGGTLACAADCSLDSAACTQCDVFAQNCPVGQACYGSLEDTVCAPAGALAEGQSCGSLSDCALGGVCVNTLAGPQCSTFCDTLDAVPGCAAEKSCIAVPAWGPDVGVCAAL
jgi:hypothetical protein